MILLFNKLIIKCKITKTKDVYLYIQIKRTMMSGRCIYVARAAYSVASTIFNNNNLLDKNNNKPFISQVVENALDFNQGIPQHKAAIWKHITHQRISGDYFYEPFLDQTSHTQIVKYEPHIFVDFRTINELAILNEYLNMYHKDIAWTYATLDARPATFPKAQQSNPDFWVYLNKALGLKNPRCTYQDEKSGMDMLEHNTRGSLGVLCYDEQGINIQMTSKAVTVEDLINCDKRKLYMLQKALKDDGLWLESNNPFKNTFNEAQQLVANMKGTSFHEFQTFHNELQNLLWKELQCNPDYNRSISFIFIKQVINTPVTEKEYLFSQAFQSKLNTDRLYNLDKKGDLRELYNAFIHAGQQIEPQFVDKLYHLHHNGITLTNDILLILKEMTKNAVH